MQTDDEGAARQAAARDWKARLSRSDAGPDDLDAFSAWREDPDNGRAWEALHAGAAAAERYVVRAQSGRFKVVDIWTGQTAVIAMTPQDGLSEDDARHTAGLLNRRAAGGDRAILQ
ncbi:DUF4880 domain-containing protein [Phenylobacterium sp. J367]|uniref:DUF4880 domain-containing protein n=1 Tax=Phenylobacterium sp. J367 TaxID=2898435 RepID=UPI0021508E04|nr:DUF4880 domain-containing protein [Phenylobacterium sp. J367]MCR5879676.1 DUF4880 domain-containing protein [Phenylobacterium sp. J367]